MIIMCKHPKKAVKEPNTAPYFMFSLSCPACTEVVNDDFVMLFLEYEHLIVVKGCPTNPKSKTSPSLLSEMKSHHWIGNRDRSKNEALLPKMMKVKENAKMK